MAKIDEAGAKLDETGTRPGFAALLRLGTERIPTFWQAQLAVWSFFFLLGLLSRGFVYQSFWMSLALTLVLEPLAFAQTGLLRVVYARLGVTGIANPRGIGVVVLLSFLAAVVQMGAATLLRALSGWSIPDWGTLQGALVPIAYYVPIFVGWSLAYFWITAELAARAERQRAMAAELDVLQGELQRLRLQLNPHFLFNVLNDIAADIPEQPEAAADMLDALAGYLRHSLDNSGRTLSSVAGELDASMAYLNVQRARFGDRLVVGVTVEPDARARQLPTFLLQPLVENAVKHGLRNASGPATIDVEVRAKGDVLQLTVKNAGRLPADWDRRGDPGVGLSNLRRRLELHYPGRHAFTLRQADDRVCAQLRLKGDPCSA